jgi:ribosomal protein S18 acetylase RimI-like enzyme
MRVLPSYQGNGLGEMLLRWELERAREMGKRVILIASPEGAGLYKKYGFVELEKLTMNLEEYGGRGSYVQTIMVWSAG